MVATDEPFLSPVAPSDMAESLILAVLAFHGAADRASDPMDVSFRFQTAEADH